MKEFYVAKNSLLMGAAMGPGKDFSFRGFPCGQAEAMSTLTVTVSAVAPTAPTDSGARVPGPGPAACRTRHPAQRRAGGPALCDRLPAGRGIVPATPAAAAP